LNQNNLCVNCSQELIRKGNVSICLRCNSELLTEAEIFIDGADNQEHVFIECPGATLYHEGTNDIEAGAKFIDDDDPSRGYEIIDHAVYAPTHIKKRRIKVEAYGRVRRCRGCQDLTVRMRRQEGPDFFVPSPKYPGRTKLKPVKYRTYA
jgi:ribosomal protein L40E